MASIRVYPAVFLFGQTVLIALVVAATPMSLRASAPVRRIPVTLHAGRDLSQYFNGRIHILRPVQVRGRSSLQSRTPIEGPAADQGAIQIVCNRHPAPAAESA